jgi:hypothetical protein
MVQVLIDERTSQAKKILAFLKTLSFVKVIEKESTPNAVTKKAIDDVEKGRSAKCKNVEDMFKRLNA